MITIEWKCKLFSQLNTTELYDLIKFRVDIFVVEQNCAYPELDLKDCDLQTMHLIGLYNDRLVCYARLLAPGVSYRSDASIGRFAVHADYRHQGIGHALMQTCLCHVQSVWPKNSIRISAQEYLHDFYAKYDFQQSSEMYLEDDIPHIEMHKKI